MTAESPAHALAKTAARLSRSVDLALSSVELSAAQYRMLLELGDGSDASTSLARKLAVTAPSVTAVVDGLVQRGLVDRQHSDEDRRKISLTLTDSGRALLNDADLAVATRLQTIASELDDSECKQAIEGLKRWERALDAHRARHAAARALPSAAGAVPA